MATRHIVSVVETTLPFEGTIDEYRCARRRFPRQDDPTRPRHIAVDIPNDRIPTLCRAKSVLLGLPARSRVRWMRASIAATALLICLASPAGARADTRTATATDGVDPGAAFDVAQVNAQTNRDAGTFSLQVKLHTPVPTSFDVLGGPHYLVVWANDADAGQCLSTAGKAGDVYVNVEPSMLDGSLQATVNTKFRLAYPKVPVTVSPDRTQLSLTFADELLKQSSHRCLQAAGSGGAYDPSKPYGTSPYDSVTAVWFDGQAPAAPAPGAGIPGASTPGGSSTSGDTSTPGCESPALRLSGATRVAHGTTGPVNVTLDEDADASYEGGAVLAMALAHDGRTFYRHHFTAADNRRLGADDEIGFFIDLDPRRKPATVTLTWSQKAFGAEEPATCTAHLNVASVRGSTPRFFARGGGIGELIPRGRHCWEVRGEAVTVTVSGAARTARFTRRDACLRFKGRARRLGALRVSQTAYGTLEFSSHGRGSARLTVKVGHRVALRRTVLSSVHSSPDRRVFEGTDAFFNYCLKHNKELFSYQLRLYCIKPGSYSEAVRFRR
jgi:hypothetical protein